MARDFKAALLAADARLLDERRLHRARARLEARLFRPARPPSRLLAIFALVSSAAIGFIVVRALAPVPPPLVGGFEVPPAREASVQISREAVVELMPDVSVIDRARGVTISSLTRTTLRREARGIRLLSGRAVFDVQKRGAGAGPVRVLVSGGAIEVRGTRFTVNESGAGSGTVELHEGAISFTDEQGLGHALAPGDVFSWPPPPQAPQAPPSSGLEDPDDELTPLGPVRPAPRKKKSAAPFPTELDWRLFDQRVHAQAVISELTQLRQQGQWADAVRLLERELDRGAPDTRERLSFELGLIYTWQLKDQQAACAHWSHHRREYPEGRFDAEIDRAAEVMGCPR
jgi:transmembrane sensor